MRAHVYRRGERWETRWQTSRRYATEAEARAAAALSYPPPPKRTITALPQVRSLIVKLHEARIDAAAIASGLNAAHVPTLTGVGQWTRTRVLYVIGSERRRRRERDERARRSEWNVKEERTPL